MFKENKITEENTFFLRTTSSCVASRLVFLGLLIGAILANIIQFPAIDYAAPTSYSIIRNYGSADLTEIGRKYASRTSRDYFGPYLAVSALTPGVNIILPFDSQFRTEELYGLGRAGKVERLHYDPETFYTEFNPSDYEIASFDGSPNRGPGELSIILSEQKAPTTFIMLRKNEIWYLVDIAILPLELGAL